MKMLKKNLQINKRYKKEEIVKKCKKSYIYAGFRTFFRIINILYWKCWLH